MAMIQKQKLRDVNRNLAAADFFRMISTEDMAATLVEQIRSMSDSELQTMSRLSGIPAHQTSLHAAMIRGEDNEFSCELNALDGWFQPGDLILMTGNQALAVAQKALYKGARSSHIAIVHADFICVDAVPKIGVSDRIITDVLENIEPGWRLIRHKSVGPEKVDGIMRACAYYLAQPYMILPSRKSAKKFAYCSELARKIYRDIGVTGTGIPDCRIIAPAHFDQLADQHPNWVDITDALRPAVDFCQKYPEILRSTAKAFIDGLELNRSRFEERTKLLARIQTLAKAGEITKESALEAIAQIREIERNMNHKFWDVPRSAVGPKRNHDRAAI